VVRLLVGVHASGAREVRVRETTQATELVYHPCKPSAAENPQSVKEQLGLGEAVVDCCSEKLCEQIGRTSCQLQDLMDDKKTFDQAYDFIQSFGEILLFEYAQAFEGNDFAFGKIPPAQKGEWMKVLAIHADLFNKKQRNGGVALLQGANLLYHMAYAIRNGAPLTPSADGATPVNFVVYVGHDTNIANVAGLLGLQWPAGDYPANEVSPGAALAFEVRRS